MSKNFDAPNCRVRDVSFYNPEETSRNLRKSRITNRRKARAGCIRYHRTKIWPPWPPGAATLIILLSMIIRTQRSMTAGVLPCDSIRTSPCHSSYRRYCQISLRRSRIMPSVSRKGNHSEGTQNKLQYPLHLGGGHSLISARVFSASLSIKY